VRPKWAPSAVLGPARCPSFDLIGPQTLPVLISCACATSTRRNRRLVQRSPKPQLEVKPSRGTRCPTLPSRGRHPASRAPPLMSNVGRQESIQPQYSSTCREAELLAAEKAEAQGNATAAFSHLERAHVLGQASTAEHVRVHWRMLLWGLRQRSLRECSQASSARLNQCCTKYIRSMRSRPTGGRPLPAFG
jgi:hypothetical protein